MEPAIEKAQWSLYRDEIRRRGGEAGIFTTPCGKGRSKGYWIHCEPVDQKDGLALMYAEGWRFYSRKYGSRKASIAYLVGMDDSGRWAVRVPATCTTVADAIDWLEPPAVKRARAAGRRVLRQGNLYLVEVKRSGVDEDTTFGRHSYYHRARVVLHPEHAPILVPPGRWTFVPQKALETGRGGAAD